MDTTTLHETGHLCGAYEFHNAHQALQKLEYREWFGLYCAVLDYEVAIERNETDLTFPEWVAKKAGGE